MHAQLFELRPVRTVEDHAWALEQIDRYWNAEEGTPAFEYLMYLSEKVEKYEDETIPTPEPDPIAMIEFYMDRNGLGQADFAKLLGSRSHASEILKRKRPLSLKQVRTLVKAWRLPADVMIREAAVTGQQGATGQP